MSEKISLDSSDLIKRIRLLWEYRFLQKERAPNMGHAPRHN